MSLNYYQILGVSPDANNDLIKRRYKELAVRYHPDKNKSPNAIQKFKKINEAYKTLSDPYKRGRYDAVLEKGGCDNYSGDGFDEVGFNAAMSIFDNFFKNNPFFSGGYKSDYQTNFEGGFGSPFGSPFRSNFMSDFKIPSFNTNNSQNGKNSTYSYSSSSISTSGVDGKVKTKRKVNVNTNGKKDSYYDEYYLDEQGRKHIIKEKGNSKLLKPYGSLGLNKNKKKPTNKNYKLLK